MKQILLILAVVLVGCGKKEPDLRPEKIITPNEAANELFVEAVGLISRADETTGQSAIALYEQGLGKLEEIITKHGRSDLAVKLISGETLFTNRSLKEIRDKVNKLKISQVEFSDPIVEEAVREELGKHFGRLTVADLERVEVLNLGETQITNAGLKEVAKLQNLIQLWLHDTQITNADLKEVAKLQKLKRLRLDNTQITDAGLKEVAKLQKLKGIELSRTRITDAGLKDLAKLQNLEGLSLSATKITDAGVAELKKALPSCEIFGP